MAESKRLDWVQGCRILITGAAGLLGQALVEEAVAQGAQVGATGRPPSIDSARFPDGVHVLRADLKDPTACRHLVADAAQLMGGLDILINNAAVLVRRRFVDLRDEEMEDAWRVNLRAPAILIQEAAPYLEKGYSPAIINVVSTAGFDGGIAPVSAYAMTKAGLIVLTKAVARELGPRGIRVNNVSPPTMDSQMQASLSSADKLKVQSMNPLGRPADVRDAARITLFVASPYASCMTGTTVDANASIR